MHLSLLISPISSTPEGEPLMVELWSEQNEIDDMSRLLDEHCWNGSRQVGCSIGMLTRRILWTEDTPVKVY